VFKFGPLASYFAGIGTVVVALSAGFAGGALVGSSWGSIERLPAVAANEYRVTATVQRREIPLVQAEAVSHPPLPDEQAVAAQAKAVKAAAERKDAAAQRKAARAERRKVAKAEWRKNAERNRQIALIEAARMQASEIPSTKQEELKASSGLGLAPQVLSQPLVQE
jgi:hypothetical protein